MLERCDRVNRSSLIPLFCDSVCPNLLPDLMFAVRTHGPTHMRRDWTEALAHCDKNGVRLPLIEQSQRQVGSRSVMIGTSLLLLPGVHDLSMVSGVVRTQHDRVVLEMRAL